MIEGIVITIAANYVVFTIGWFLVTCKHWLSLAALHHKHTVEFELQKAEAIIREEAVNLAREIENLTKKEIAIDVVKIAKTTKEIKSKQSVKGFEGRVEFLALSTSCCLPDMVSLSKRTTFTDMPEYYNDGSLAYPRISQS